MNLQKPILVNAVLFQIGWWAVVLTSTVSTWLPAFITMIILILHFRFVSKEPWLDLKLMMLATTMGFVVDSTMLRFEIYKLPMNAKFAPIWLLCLWALFSISLRLSMRWLWSRLPVSALLGAIFGPLSYAAGSKLGILDFGSPQLLCIALSSLSWMIAMPVLMVCARRET